MTATDHEVTLLTVAEDPTAEAAATTTWAEFPALWGELLDEVWAVIRAGGAEKSGHNVMLYKDDAPTVEVGAQVAGPFAPVGRVVPSVWPLPPQWTMRAPVRSCHQTEVSARWRSM